MTAEPIDAPGDSPGRTVSVAEAEAHLSELFKAVEGGDVVSITRRGRPIATLTAVTRPKKRIDLEWLRSMTDGMPYSDVSSVDLIRETRDSRY